VRFALQRRVSVAMDLVETLLPRGPMPSLGVAPRTSIEESVWRVHETATGRGKIGLCGQSFLMPVQCLTSRIAALKAILGEKTRHLTQRDSRADPAKRISRPGLLDSGKRKPLRSCLRFRLTHPINCFAIPNTFSTFAAGIPNVHRTVSHLESKVDEAGRSPPPLKRPCLDGA
jgi:hypothetical protein